MTKYSCKITVALLFISSIAHGITLENTDFSIAIEPETLKMTYQDEIINEGTQYTPVEKQLGCR